MANDLTTHADWAKRNNMTGLSAASLSPLFMIARIKAWIRFDAETVASTASALAAFSGAPLLVPYVSERDQQSEEAPAPVPTTLDDDAATAERKVGDLGATPVQALAT